MTSKCDQCGKDYAMRWTTSDMDLIRQFREELIQLQQDGERKIRQSLENMKFDLVTVPFTLPHEGK
jgi:hypothetical protein